MDRLTDKQLAYHLRRAMRSRGCSLLAACRERQWHYHRVYRRLHRAGLLKEVLRAKYEEAEA